MSQFYTDGEPDAPPVFDLYTDEVVRHILAAKPRLPKDFPLITEDREYFIVICIPMSDFAGRTVEQRLAIALELEQLRTQIEETGIRCVIEKN